MRQPGSEKSLRRLVLDLTRLQQADVDGILAELDDAQRGRVEALLLDARGLSASGPVEASSDPLDRLSPWLVERLQGQGRSGVRMTPATLGALRAAARDLDPSSAATHSSGNSAMRRPLPRFRGRLGL